MDILERAASASPIISSCAVTMPGTIKRETANAAKLRFLYSRNFMVALIVAVDGIGRKTTTTVLSLSGLYDNLNTNYSRHDVSTFQLLPTGLFMTSAVPHSPLFTGPHRSIATAEQRSLR